MTLQWLDTFARCAKFDTPALKDVGLTRLNDLNILKFLVGTEDTGDPVMDISLELVVHPQAPFVPGSETESFREHEFKIASIRNVLTIGNYAKMKPTMAQYAWLCAVMPGEPQWYRGIATREEFAEVMRLSDTPIY